MERERYRIIWLRWSISSDINSWKELFENMILTWLLSLFTSVSNPSREILAGIWTAGANGLPSSSETNWTTTFEVGSEISGSGAVFPWYIFWRLGGGNSVAIVNSFWPNSYGICWRSEWLSMALKLRWRKKVAFIQLILYFARDYSYPRSRGTPPPGGTERVGDVHCTQFCTDCFITFWYS